ncbi:MAG: hypothetical protein DIU68_013330 [Chloroflexota bacterium]
MSDKATLLCPHCQIGHLQEGMQTYVRVVNGMVISMPDTTAYTCDVCGFQEFDYAALAHVDTLIGSERASSGIHRQSVKPTFWDVNVRHGLKR